MSRSKVEFIEVRSARRAIPAEPRVEFIAALEADKTLLVKTGTPNTIANWTRPLRSRGFRVRTVRQDDGIVVWAEKRDGA